MTPRSVMSRPIFYARPGDVVEAAGASAALDILKAHNAIEVALVDCAMPLVSG